MSSVLVTPPDTEPIALHEARAHLRVDHHAEDELISLQIVAARGYAEEYTGHALITQTWDEVLDGFPGDRDPIELSRPPLRDVLSITFLDVEGVEQTLHPSAYRVDPASRPGRIAPMAGTNWPATRQEIASVRIRYLAGYGEHEDVPELAKAGIKLVLGLLYEQRAESNSGSIVSGLDAADALFDLAFPRITWSR